MSVDQPQVSLRHEAQAQVRAIQRESPTALEGACPICNRTVEHLNDRISVPVERVANRGRTAYLARALRAAGLDRLPTRGVECDAPAHGRVLLVTTAVDQRAAGWDGQVGIPLDCGADGLQFAPVATDAIPDPLLAAMARGLESLEVSE